MHQYRYQYWVLAPIPLKTLLLLGKHVPILQHRYQVFMQIQDNFVKFVFELQ